MAETTINFIYNDRTVLANAFTMELNLTVRFVQCMRMSERGYFSVVVVLFFGNEINLLVDVVLMAAKQKRRCRTLFKHEIV